MIGSHGVFCEISSSDKKMLDFYARLGFLHIPKPAGTTHSDNTLFMGRVI